MTLPILIFATLAALATAPATERPYALMPGDPAPALAVREWVQGDPVTRFEPGQIYVIDFWATWCGPCKKSMPALSAMQREYGDKVVFVALNTWDYADRVAPFVAEMGEKLAYRVAIDEQTVPTKGVDNIPMYVKEHGSSSQRWLKASGLQDDGIPVLCVVDRSGKLAWVGSEPGQLKPALDAMLAGTWDLDGYAATYAKDAGVLKQGRTLESKIWNARQKRDWKTAIGHARDLMDIDDRYHRMAGLVFRLTWGELGSHAGALDFGNAQMKRNTSAEAFVQMAGAIAADERATGWELASAEKFAKRANELAKQEAPEPQAALGKLAMRRGDHEAAAKFQRRAIELTSDPDERTEAEKVLKGYEK